MAKILELVSDEAPINTFIEVVAQGAVDRKTMQHLSQLTSSMNVGEKFTLNEISDENSEIFGSIGKSSSGSNSTVKAAKLLNIGLVEGYGSGNNLGPVFVKKVR